MDPLKRLIAPFKESSSDVTSLLWNIYTISLLFYHVTKVSCYQSGYYVDNGHQTLSRRPLPNWREQETAIGQELMTMLGIDRKPNVLPGEKYHKSAPIFMKELYKQLQYDTENIWDSAHNLNKIHFNLSIPGISWAAGDADMIMSFQNQGKLDLTMTRSKIQNIQIQDNRISLYGIKFNRSNGFTWVKDAIQKAIKPTQIY